MNLNMIKNALLMKELDDSHSETYVTMMLRLAIVFFVWAVSIFIIY